MYCRDLANRLRNLPVHVKGYVRLQIEQLTYQLQFYDHPVAGMSSGMFPGISSGMTYQRPQYTLLQPFICLMKVSSLFKIFILFVTVMKKNYMNKWTKKIL